MSDPASAMASNRTFEVLVTQRPEQTDSLAKDLVQKLPWLGIRDVVVRTGVLFHFGAELDLKAARALAERLFLDPVMELASVKERSQSQEPPLKGVVSVFKKPGVMEPWVDSILRGASQLGHTLTDVRVGHRYQFDGLDAATLRHIASALLANEAVETIVVEGDRFPAKTRANEASTHRTEVPIAGLDDAALDALSRDRTLSLKTHEMRTVQAHFLGLGRAPTEVELETIAQTWSEHCKHKTFTSPISYDGPAIGSLASGAAIKNLLSETVKDATETIDAPFCLSVFHDNAGVIAFEGDQALCFKVETHNHPSAIEPYGGSGTGIGGVIRDILGTGLGARPVANIDVFCVGPLDMDDAALPPGTMHPLRILRGVVSGVRDYGNQMGIPTVSGGVFFDERYVGNPLVYAGTVGLLPVDCVDKEVRPGDAIVAMGGLTGRDGIHGATFSSVELHSESETVDAGAVQIGNAIQEKKVADVLLAARDLRLFRGVTDCGAGGFSSAIGEMGEKCGARVHLDRAPLKYAGLSPSEIWISEAQERMVLAVPPEHVDELLALCNAEDVVAVVLGEFTDTGRLEVHYEQELVAELDMGFLHDGLPKFPRDAEWRAPVPDIPSVEDGDATEHLLRILSAPNVASKEWIIRQYDHEVQCASVVKPLVGTEGQGPSDAAVMAPILGSTAGFAIGSGMNPCYSDLDPYLMAQAAIDEALRNVVAVGADPDHCAILDNFSWGNTDKPDRLGALVRAAYGCRDAAIALKTPFISGKDSLNNEYRAGNQTIVIPHSLLISAIAKVKDVRLAVTMDLKAADNVLYVVGVTKNEMGGSHYHRVNGRLGESAPTLDPEAALRTFRALHRAMGERLVRSCHDLSEGGLAVALAEMVLAGEVGALVNVNLVPIASTDLATHEVLFSESLSRFVVEVEPAHTAAFEKHLTGVVFARIGETTEDGWLRISDGGDVPIVAAHCSRLEQAFRAPLTAHLKGREATHG